MSAIIIPSKHIYWYENSKVIDNQINAIEYKVNRVEPDNQYSVSVYNEEFYEQKLSNPSTNKSNGSGLASAGTLSGGGYTLYL